VAFFPQLVAGPIERAAHLLPQFERDRTFHYAWAVSGLTRVYYGGSQDLPVAR
jgi:D-alanyl-lipoteichoic acid acyltransferase DltB (MBOAT superfamily)